MNQTELQNPLSNDKFSFDIQISELILLQNFIDQEQSANLISIIDMTQAHQVEYAEIQKWQNEISKIKTNELILSKNLLDQTKSIIYEQQITQTSQFHKSMNQSLLSKSNNQNLSLCSFKLINKKQQNEKQKSNTQQQQIQIIPKKHQCEFKETKNQKFTQPQKYRSISSQYSPKRLSDYLNPNESQLNINQKWLKKSQQSHSPQLRIVSQISQEQIKNNFGYKSIVKPQSMASKHLMLSNKQK